MKINDIIDAIRAGKIRITDHADEEAQADRLSFDEIFYSVFQGEIIEDYQDDKPYPSCLVYGDTFSENPVHSVWAYNSENQWAVLITVYRPDPLRWIDWRTRRPKR
ncbi:MAG TPA: DUF4258 domain-containing protein [Chloroflexi bacterium]|nr:MAG: hypothetical protein B6243_04665 [Anaerolineaceae bacterium 4572_5.2]HEY84187.1 DUF4258 domain-containing protein [Chloroflexota bacterium]